MLKKVLSIRELRNAPHIDAKEWKTEDDLRASVLRMMDWGKNNWITRFELQDLLDYVLESMEPPGGYDGRRTAKNRLDQLVSKCEGYPQLTHEVTALFRECGRRKNILASLLIWMAGKRWSPFGCISTPIMQRN